MIEQRNVTERELRVEECDECHVPSIIGGATLTSLLPVVEAFGRAGTQSRADAARPQICRRCWLHDAWIGVYSSTQLQNRIAGRKVAKRDKQQREKSFSLARVEKVMA